MDINSGNVKYSIFGNFDFINDTPEIIEKLYNCFQSEKFIPNMLPLLKIGHPDEAVARINRPQLVNKELQCTITFLPDRIDIEVVEKLKFENVIDYYKKIIDIFDLNLNRIAVNRDVRIRNLSGAEKELFIQKMGFNEFYVSKARMVEYTCHRVAREQCEALRELINIGINLSSQAVSDEQDDIDFIQIGADINTRGEMTKERFDLQNCKDFFEFADAKWEEIRKHMVELLNGK